MFYTEQIVKNAKFVVIEKVGKRKSHSVCIVWKMKAKYCEEKIYQRTKDH